MTVQTLDRSTAALIAFTLSLLVALGSLPGHYPIQTLALPPPVLPSPWNSLDLPTQNGSSGSKLGNTIGFLFNTLV